MYFNNKKKSNCIIIEANVFLEIVICVAVDSKSGSTQGKAQVFINVKGTKICNSNGS